MVVGSPTEAGRRLHQQAMESLYRKREYAAEVIRLRDLEKEPTISYPGFRSRSKLLLTPTSSRNGYDTPSGDTFESFKKVSAAPQTSTSSLDISKGLQATFGMHHHNTTSSRN